MNLIKKVKAIFNKPTHFQVDTLAAMARPEGTVIGSKGFYNTYEKIDGGYSEEIRRFRGTYPIEEWNNITGKKTKLKYIRWGKNKGNFKVVTT